MGSLREEAEVVVVGGGPGGYVAAIRAADLGKQVVLVEERERLGGVCLLEGCIPSKTLIHAVQLVHEVREAARIGISFGEPRVDLDALRRWTEEVVSGLSSGVRTLLERRGVEVVHGRARFDGPRSLAVEGGGLAGIEFRKAILATGSRPLGLAGVADDLGLWSARDALSLPRVPERLAVLGGGYIGLEIGLLYAGLGSAVTVVELSPRLLAGVDPDLVTVMMRTARSRLAEVRSEARVVAVERAGDGFSLTIVQGGERSTLEADAVLAAVGRAPRSEDLGLDKAGVEVSSRGFVTTDEQQRTTSPHVYAIGDVTAGPMLAHKASREGKVAAEVIAGEPAAFDNRAIPAVVFTDPEIAWTGYTEEEARAAGLAVEAARFPLSALGRARTLGRTDGLVKVVFEPGSGLLRGVGIVGVSASELVAEATLAIEMGATLEDLMVTIHPHPTLSESIAEAAELAAGTPVHVLPRKRPARG